VDRDALSDGTTLTNPAETFPAIKRTILWEIADHGMRMNLASCTDLRAPKDHRGCSETTPRPDPHRTADHNVRPYDRRGIDCRLWVDNGSWMNAHWPALSRRQNDI
jgi:hypothetical protein